MYNKRKNFGLDLFINLKRAVKVPSLRRNFDDILVNANFYARFHLHYQSFKPASWIY